MRNLTLCLSLLVALASALMIMSCGDSGGGAGGSGGSSGATISAGGIAWAFNFPGLPYGRIVGAKVSILENQELNTTTDDMGAFTIEGLPVGTQATFALEHDNHPLTYTKTFTIPDSDIDDLTFQIPSNFLFEQIELGLEIETDPNKCQIVSTFTRFGKTIGDEGHHGEPGAILGVAPDNNAEEGPIYFNDDVLPDRTRTYSSLDGGVLLINVEPGDYTLTASCVEGEDRDAFIAEYPSEHPAYENESLRCQTEDVEFESILMKCQPGVFLNASPSYGLQALE